jgi:hypothetical protein
MAPSTRALMEGEGGDEEGCVIPGARKEKGGRLTSGPR